MPACVSFPGPDLWYTLQVPLSGLMELRLDSRETIGNRSTVSHSFEVYRGECENLLPIVCSYDDNDEDEDNGDFQLVQLSESDGIIPGETLLIRVWQPRPLISLGFELMAMDPNPIKFESIPTLTTWQRFLLALFVVTILGIGLSGMGRFKLD